MLWIALIVPDLPLQVFTRGLDEPGLLAVVEMRPRQRLVCASPAATAQGVESGGSLAGALAVAPALVLAQRDLALERATLEELAVWGSRFTPSVSLAPPNAILLEVGSCLRLFGGVEALVENLQSGARALGLEIAFAAAPTPLAALWLATVTPGTLLSPRPGWEACLDLLPVALLCEGGSVSQGTLELLRGIGMKTLGDVARLPRDGLARRQAAEVTRTLARARGDMPDVRSWHRPPERFASRVVLPVPMATTEPLLFAASRLISAMVAWLEGLHAAIDRFSLVLEHEKAPATVLEIVTGQPGRDASRLLMLVREHLAAKSLEAPVEALQLLADSPLARPGHTPDLFGDPGQVRDSAAMLLDRLRARLGRQAVRSVCPWPDHRPEQAWRAAEPGDKNAGAATLTTSRPTWLLQTPRALGSIHDLALLHGPERIESGWWDGNDVRRDYFVARAPSAALWWIFRDLDSPGNWYLHGYFG